MPAMRIANPTMTTTAPAERSSFSSVSVTASQSIGSTELNETVSPDELVVVVEVPDVVVVLVVVPGAFGLTTVGSAGALVLSASRPG